MFMKKTTIIVANVVFFTLSMLIISCNNSSQGNTSVVEKKIQKQDNTTVAKGDKIGQVDTKRNITMKDIAGVWKMSSETWFLDESGEKKYFTSDEPWYYIYYENGTYALRVPGNPDIKFGYRLSDDGRLIEEQGDERKIVEFSGGKMKLETLRGGKITCCTVLKRVE